ncbi:LysR family transcriptional regulator [Paracoccus aurantiacus]|uniref:LysR family transcriptional regulator n=1 Tax=Paracoccus aurantiacus TaxID=2599412 RepID=A0A5C6SB41_9RHOB|nr:LysR family transcriptional regulator [Paracoccus aurantiacus]TXB70825.1 LysR family transcriptional regulator [Paracoccus aurantiacus]
MARRLSRTDLGDLNLFRVVAETGGFRKAAKELDMSPSAVSHAMRGLEERQGVRLFNRTNRSVTLTPAGRDLLAEIQAGFTAIETGLEALNQYRERPAGHLRINILSDAARLIVGPVLADYARTYPDVRLEIVVDDRMVDIVRDGFDAGIRYGGTVPEDMIAIPLGPELRWVMAASPDYLSSAPSMDTPDDLQNHRCITMRMGNGQVYHWELERGDETVTFTYDWPVIANDTVTTIEFAESGGGICYTLEERIRAQLTDGRLVEVLPKWSSMGPAFHLYYPSRRQLPEALRALLRIIQSAK